MLAAGHDGKPSKQKIALLLHVARKQAIKVHTRSARRCCCLVLYRQNKPPVMHIVQSSECIGPKSVITYVSV